MAKNRRASPAARAAATQRSDRNFNTEINAAVAATEQEITDSIFDDEELDLDADTSLEQMSDDIDGDTDIDDGDADDEGDDGDTLRAGAEEEDDDQQDDDDQGDEDRTGDDLDDEGDDGDGQQAADDDQDISRGLRGRFVPRARVTEEANKRRNGFAARDRELDELRGQVRTLTEIMQRGGQPQPTQTQTQQPQEDEEPPRVDMFADPEGYEKWRNWDTRRQVREAVQAAVAPIERRSAEVIERNVDESMSAMASGPRGDEFRVAYDTLTRLPRNRENGRLVERIMHSANPAEALMGWWDREQADVADEYDRQVAARLADRYGLELPPELQPARGARRQQQQRQPVRGNEGREQPRGDGQRTVFRGPRPLRSLNGAGGSTRQHVDPRGLDGSDQSVVDYIFG